MHVACILACNYNAMHLYLNRAWIQYHLMIKLENEQEQFELTKARKHFTTRHTKITLRRWHISSLLNLIMQCMLHDVNIYIV
jgi:hypothetical protein